ncbi:MAG: hypothetical protein J7L77_10355 [Clostridiales bacterium]|nr:hypothetical protein [Clostridiales bacterium]
MSKKIIIILVIILFIGIFVQTAVVVDYYSESFNLGFFKSSNDAGTYYKILDDSIRDEYFKPYEIQVRFDQKTFLVGTENNLFTNLWTDAQDVFKAVLTGELTQTYELWDRLCDNPGVSVTFGSYFPSDYLSFMLGLEINEELDIRIDKIMIVPGEEEMTVYLHTDDSYNYKIILNPSGLFRYSNFSNMTELFTKNVDFISESKIDFYKVYGNNPDAVWRNYVEPDIPISFDLSYHYIPWIYVGVPEDIVSYINAAKSDESNIKTEIMDNISDVIKAELLNKSANLYKTHYDSFGNLFFTNQFNMFEIDDKGWVNYKYTPGTEGDEKGAIGDAFINAYETLSTISNLVTENPGEIFVARIEENDNSYTFKFDYKYNSKVLAIGDKYHAAVITSTATRTIEASVLPLVFRDMVDEAQVEIPYVFDFNTNLILHNLNDLNLIEAYNIYIGYGTFSGSQNLIGPVWIFEKKSGEKEVYTLQRGKE